MRSSLSDLVDNLEEKICKINWNCDCFLEYESVKKNLIKYKWWSCNKDYIIKIDEKLKTQFRNTNKFSNNNIHKIIQLLRKGVYPYEYLDEWEKFNEILLPKEVNFIAT